MLLERVSIALRPRNPWEAMDLGFRMVRAWWRPVYASWCAVNLPYIAVVTLLAAPGGHPWLALLAIWWVKPLMERAPLYVLSRAVFGDTPRMGEILRALPGVYRPAPLWRLLITRLSPTRAFCLPVLILERLKGKAWRARCAVLLKSHYGAATWLTLVCVHFEWILAGGAFYLVEMLLPRTVEIQIDNAHIFSPGIATPYLWMWYGATVLSYLIIGPLYVAGGFALYLNRRTLLEAWDIELGFRRMAARLAQPAAMAAVVLMSVATVAPGSTYAANAGVIKPPSNAQAKAAIEQVMRRPEFSTKEIVEVWEYKDKSPDKAREPSDFNFEFLSRLGSGLAWVVKGALYLALFAGIVWLILYRERWLNILRGIKPAPAQAIPQQLFGLDIRPESLPADVAAAALNLWRQGNARAALSLLYRGALSRLAGGGLLQLKASDTEGDCETAVSRVAPGAVSMYFAHLTRAWQMVAYAARTPAPEQGEKLCADFDVHFAKPGA